ncbi:hypothetical protein IFM89_016523 [Coptis chinensis]|uniref:RNase H type-1 domain-containing protein n=1 Tax=Coptis chinensis TaxID=261450 RepID=A0A835IPQ0_9MAGN|nr:hypothetical protein IFM89_016523 [Coptis chinensis]
MEDERLWTPDLKGVFSVKSAFEEIRMKKPIVRWSKIVWRSFIHPQLSAIAWKLVNTDGAAKNNPGEVDVSVAGRNLNGEFVFVYSRNIGIATNYMAECTAILEGMEIAVSKGRASIWVESDSRAVVTAFNSGKIPWQLKQISIERIADQIDRLYYH